MRLLAKRDDLFKVLVVDVGVHPEQPLQDRLGDGLEVGGDHISVMSNDQDHEGGSGSWGNNQDHKGLSGSGESSGPGSWEGREHLFYWEIGSRHLADPEKGTLKVGSWVSFQPSHITPFPP